MTSAINAVLSGLNAATTRINVAANNLANQNTTQSTSGNNKPYTPQIVDQVSLSNGGVAATTRDAPNPTTNIPDSTSPGGTKKVPNVDGGNELNQINLASLSYKANLKVLQAQQNLDQSLINIKS